MRLTFFRAVRRVFNEVRGNGLQKYRIGATEEWVAGSRGAMRMFDLRKYRFEMDEREHRAFYFVDH